MLQPVQWLWSVEHRQPSKVVEPSSHWDDTSCHLWLPAADAGVRATPDRLNPLDAADAGQEQAQCADEFKRRSQVLPQLTPPLLLRIC